MWFIIYFNPIICSKCFWLICFIVYQVYYFLIFHYNIIIIDLKLSITFCFFSGEIFLFLGIFLITFFRFSFLKLLWFVYIYYNIYIYIYFFRYFFINIICNCLVKFLKPSCKQFYYQSNHQLLLLFFELLFLKHV